MSTYSTHMHCRKSDLAMLHRLLVLAGALSLVLVLVPHLALAAPPTNDTFANATAAAIGFRETLDTTDATTDSDDVQLNTQCGFPITDATVWYTFVAEADTRVEVDFSQSDYIVSALIGVGSQGNLALVTCGSVTVGFLAAAGTTYYVLALDDQFDGGGNGGLLSISFNEAPPPPTLDITVNRFGQKNARTGVATISGTYMCTNSGYFSIFTQEARQNVGRFTIFGEAPAVDDGFVFFDEDTCDGAPHPWAVDVFPQNGKFAGGKAMTRTVAVTCNSLNECDVSSVEQTVQLRGGGK